VLPRPIQPYHCKAIKNTVLALIRWLKYVRDLRKEDPPNCVLTPELKLYLKKKLKLVRKLIYSGTKPTEYASASLPLELSFKLK
jgi:hypothetical protein